LPDKTYKFVSVCDKPLQTNNKSIFISHVSWCPTCRAKLPKSIIEELEPRLSQLIAERTAGKVEIPPKEPPPKEESKEEPKVTAPSLEEQQKAKLDALIKDSPSFQGLGKSVEGVKADVARLSGQFNGFEEQISSQMKSLGETMGTKLEELVGGGGSTGEAPPTGEEPSGGEKPPSKTLSTEQERLHEGGADLSEAGADQRPSPFGQPDELPAAMQPGYKAGESSPPKETPPRGAPPKETPSSEGEKPPSKERAPSGGKRDDLPKLKGPSEIEAVEAWLAKEKRKQGLGEEEKPKKKRTIPYISDIKDVIREGRELVQEFRGGEKAPSSEESKGKSFRDFADQLASKILERSIENLAGPPSQTIGMEQMNTIIRLLGTFFTGVRALPKPMAEEMIRRIMEAGVIPTIPSSEGPLPGGGSVEPVS